MEYRPSFSDQLDIDYISHHGIKGMKWGVRRYQNEDGTLTPVGKKQRKQNSKNKMGYLNPYQSDPHIKKHVKWDDNGHIIKISNKLEKALGAPLDMIDDDELIYLVAMELES